MHKYDYFDLPPGAKEENFYYAVTPPTTAADVFDTLRDAVLHQYHKHNLSVVADHHVTVYAYKRRRSSAFKGITPQQIIDKAVDYLQETEGYTPGGLNAVPEKLTASAEALAESLNEVYALSLNPVAFTMFCPVRRYVE